ncbi:hypothetical protein BMG05_01105 [Mycobacterium malmoense]|nr:hypothetical protein BMG05_01105 [Mycobacterium malmoense]
MGLGNIAVPAGFFTQAPSLGHESVGLLQPAGAEGLAAELLHVGPFGAFTTLPPFFRWQFMVRIKSVGVPFPAGR